ncbi:MAG: PhoU domain-containing protein [Verrucomicrobiota bacterium]
MTEKDKEHMRGIFKGPLLKLRETLLMMASLTDRNFTVAMNSLTERDASKGTLVEAEDTIVDKLEVDIDAMVVVYLSTHGAAATACRLVLATSKISEALESIADQAVTIARRSQKLCELPELPLDLEIMPMAQLSLRMMREGIDCFVDVAPDKVLDIVALDKKVDSKNRENERVLCEIMSEHPDYVQQCIHYMLISRALERVGDYAKHIAQEVYYLYMAEDIRHRQLASS